MFRILALFSVVICCFCSFGEAAWCGKAIYKLRLFKNRYGACKVSLSFTAAVFSRFTETVKIAHTGGFYVNTNTGRYENILTPGLNPRVFTTKKRYTDYWRITPGTGKMEMTFPYIRISSTNNRGQFCHGRLHPVSFTIDEACTSTARTFTTSLYTKVGDDVVFVIDSTGSMRDDIASVKASSTNIVNAIARSPNFRVGFVEYNDPTASMLQDFSNNRFRISNTISKLKASGGGDFPEHVYSGIKIALDMNWRPSASRTIILMGDAPPKDPEPGTGLTKAQIVALANRVNILADTTPSVRSIIHAELQRVLRQSAENGSLSVPVSGINPLLMVPIGTSSSVIEKFESLANETDGKVFPATDADDVVEAIEEAIEEVIPMSPSPTPSSSPSLSATPSPSPSLSPSPSQVYEICTGVVTAPTTSVVCVSDGKVIRVSNSNDCKLQIKWTDNFTGTADEKEVVPGMTDLPVSDEGGTVWFDFEWYNPSTSSWERDSTTTSSCST